MPYLWVAGFAQDNRNDIKTKRTVPDIICFEEITGGTVQSFLFGICNRSFRCAKGNVCPCSYLDEDDRAVSVDHNNVDFAGPAEEVARECF